MAISLDTRDVVLARDGRRCYHCGGSSRLCVHHVAFGPGVRQTHEPDKLLTLCGSCHSRLHHRLARIRQVDNPPEKRAKARSLKVWSDEWERWRKAAKLQRISLTQWARAILNRNAERQLAEVELTDTEG